MAHPQRSCLPHMTHPLQQAAHAIRFLSIDAIVKATEGHQGVPLGMAEIATALYLKHLRHDPSAPDWFDRDRVVLSNGHGSMLLYALLHLSGYAGMSLDQIQRFRELDSHCAGHPERDPALGIEVTTGPLGQGIGNALGMAVAEAHLRARFGPHCINHRTYAFVGDGCLQEGVGQEMIALAGHLKLGHLTLLWDDNAITDDGSTDLSISEDVAERFAVANWHVQRVDGHDIDAVDRALTLAKQDDRPSLIACRTTIAKGIARLQGQRGGHSARLFDADAEQARQDLNWPHPPFVVPEEVMHTWRQAAPQWRQARTEWQARIEALPTTEREALESLIQGQISDRCEAELQAYAHEAQSGGKLQGGILISAEINERLSAVVPERIVCCADLEAPTSHKRGLKAFSAHDPSGSYVHCGVREHVMGAMANGMAAHGGVIPLAVTYLSFSDYERPAIRMAAMMRLPVKFVYSHDSIGIGKNGPTHQPVEILAALRAMPNHWTMRPADAVEASECWSLAMAQRQGPVSLVFARQDLPLVRTQPSHDNLSAKGAYVLHESGGGPRRITLLATGSEVNLAVRARERLQAQGIGTAVVSMPCWDLFNQQPDDYRESVLGPRQGRIGIEAALRFGWDQYLGLDGGFIGMTGFGASGPADQLYTRFGITVDAIVQQALKQLT